MLSICLGLISLVIWIYLIFARGGYWRMPLLAHEPLQLSSHPPVAAIIPARNEAGVVAAAIQSLLAQDYPGPLHVFLVDDASSDGTAEAALGAARQAGAAGRLTVVPARRLPDGWTGKLWAVSEGVQAAASFGAVYFLFSDADIVHPPGAVAELLARAEAGDFDLVSLMARLSCESLAERALIPAFVYFFFMLYPPAWVADPGRRTAAAAGGCILIRTAALPRIGGLAAIRAEIIDDCALARAVKRGGRIWLGLASETGSVRRYSWRQLGQMISRSAFTQLHHSWWLLLATIAAMGVTFLVPPLLIAANALAAGLGTAAWLLMAVSFAPILRYYRRSSWWAPLLPLIAVFYMGATLHSAMQFWRGRGGVWKGRVQDPARP